LKGQSRERDPAVLVTPHEPVAKGQSKTQDENILPKQSQDGLPKRSVEKPAHQQFHVRLSAQLGLGTFLPVRCSYFIKQPYPSYLTRRHHEPRLFAPSLGTPARLSRRCARWTGYRLGALLDGSCRGQPGGHHLDQGS